MSYQILEISLADTDRLYQYHIRDVFGAEFTIKGFDYPWLLSSRAWKRGDKVLDVGQAYSPIPAYLQKKYGCEVWAADDFGLTVDDDFWTRHSSPKEHIEKHPEVKFILERLGDPARSSLPREYFDVVSSLSVLEHVPCSLMPAVWQHMDMLLKPGGEMLHAVDMLFPSNGGLRKLLISLLFDWLHPFMPLGLKQKHVLATPLNYVRQAARILGIHAVPTKHLDVLTMCFNPEILVESYQYGLNRMKKDNIQDFHFNRFGSLLFRLKKIS